MAMDDLTAHPEAEACAVVSLGAEEGFEHTLLGVGVDTLAGVGDGKEHSFAAGRPVSSFAASDEEAASGGHGVDRVGDEVAEDLADIAFVAFDESVGAFAFFDGDIGVAQAGFVEIERWGEEAEAGDFSWIGGLTVKAERLVGDDGDAAELEFGLFQPFLDVGNGGAAAAEEEQIRDGFEGIVDLVGHAGGEPADGRELFTLDKGGDRTLILEQIMAGLDERHDLAGEGFEAGDLLRREIARLAVDYADAAEDVAVRRDDGGSGVEADVGISEDEGIVGEAWILQCVRNDEGSGVGKGVGAEAFGSGCFTEIDADSGFEPLAVLIDEGDDGDGGLADERGERRDVVKLRLGERVEDGVATQRG